MTLISESDLVIPALFLLDSAEDGLNTSQLIEQLALLLHPAGDDLTILAGRNDTKFSQKVRNLVSHKTLTDRGLVTRPAGQNTPFRITDAGRELYLPHAETLVALTDFSLDDSAEGLNDIKQGKTIEVLDDHVIREGELRTRTTEYRVRSSALRQAAMEKYTCNGRIHCRACCFDFARAYPGIGDGIIHIHHLKPVSYMRGEPMNMDEALENVRPLCPNCHRIVHTKKPPLSIATVRASIAFSYNYS